MRVLAIERPVPGVGPERFTRQVLASEARRVRDLQLAGTIREIYFRADETSAVVLLECADVDEARRALGTLPLVSEGLIAFEVMGLVRYPGFDRLAGG